MVDRSFEITERLLVRDAARLPSRGGRVVPLRAGRVPMEQIRTERRVPPHGERPADLFRLAVVPGHVVDDEHATDLPPVDGFCEVRLDLVTVMPRDRDRPGLNVIAQEPPLSSVRKGTLRAMTSPDE